MRGLCSWYNDAKNTKIKPREKPRLGCGDGDEHYSRWSFTLICPCFREVLVCR